MTEKNISDFALYCYILFSHLFTQKCIMKSYDEQGTGQCAVMNIEMKKTLGLKEYTV